jgi:hypothetical protein
MFVASAAHGTGSEKLVNHFGSCVIVEFACPYQCRKEFARKSAVPPVNGRNQIDFVCGDIFIFTGCKIINAALGTQTTVNATV